jgi:proteic killer suppression protein
MAFDVINAVRYYLHVIRSFRNREAERVFERERSRRLPPDVQRRAHRKMLLLDAAEALGDLRVPPGNRLERLRGDRAGQYSIRVNDQWRICFRWKRGDVYDVEIADYH